jgi:hypothetical protein
MSPLKRRRRYQGHPPSAEHHRSCLQSLDIQPRGIARGIAGQTWDPWAVQPLSRPGFAAEMTVFRSWWDALTTYMASLRGAGSWLGSDLLFINFVPTSIYRPEVCLRTTETAARKAGVRLDQLVFEVTEGHRIDDLSHLERVFDYYRSRNCKVALDDLGAGYSSLNLLIRLQPDIVKLDKEIVQDLPGPVGSAVVAAIVGIVQAYGGLVLAECVETTEQAAAASELGGQPRPGLAVRTAGTAHLHRAIICSAGGTASVESRAASRSRPAGGNRGTAKVRSVEGSTGGIHHARRDVVVAIIRRSRESTNP